MTSTGTPPKIFDAKRHQAKLDRAYMRASDDCFLWDYMADDVADRLRDVSRNFRNILLLGPALRYEGLLIDALNGESQGRKVTKITFALAEAEATGAAMVQGDILPIETQSFDLIICFGILDIINDLPGMLFQLRHALKPDGLLTGSLFGAGTLSSLKSAMMAADGERAVPHIHPQISLQNMSDLMSRTGYTMPVTDQDLLTVRYSLMSNLIEDLRNMGLGNCLIGPAFYLGKDWRNRLESSWTALAEEDGKTPEYFNFLHFHGWAPSPSQPKPAARGSGTVSLADALKKT